MQSRSFICAVIGLGLLATAAAAQPAESPALRWFKGNTHTHTWWSDGDSPPETVVAWYKEHGYNFLVLSDHNTIDDAEKWVVPKGENRLHAAERYEKTFGPDWIVKRVREDKTEYRLKTLTEFRPLFEEVGKFLLIQGEEISDSVEKRPVHVNGVNLREPVKPLGGATIYDCMQNNINAVLEQRERTGQPMLPHLNHPNFQWAITADDIMRLRGERLFEIQNGHPSVHNYGDARRMSVERMWDLVLTRRLTDLNLPVMYGLATDDAHNYTTWGSKSANPGRAWIMVRSRYLTPQHIVAALEEGNFYATTGVLLDDVSFKDNTLELRIQPRPGVSYVTRFIGTIAGYNQTTAPATAPADQTDSEIGKVLAEQSGTNPSYHLTGREIYVRAKVISSAKHPNPHQEGDVEIAWVQPVSPR